MRFTARSRSVRESPSAAKIAIWFGTYEEIVLDTYGNIYADGTLSQGGYSSHIRAHEHFTFPIPDSLKTELTAPMLCAGLTAYSPLVRNGAGPGKKVGIVGM